MTLALTIMAGFITFSVLWFFIFLLAPDADGVSPFNKVVASFVVNAQCRAEELELRKREVDMKEQELRYLRGHR